MRAMKQMSNDALEEKIVNECICKKLDIDPIEDKMRDNWLKLFRHVQLKIISHK